MRKGEGVWVVTRVRNFPTGSETRFLRSSDASIQQMATPISIANIARVAAGVVAMLWAFVGIGDALAAVTARGLDAVLGAEIVAGIALVAGAAMALTRRRRWRPLVVVAAAALTLVRFLSVLGTAGALLAVSSLAMFLAIAVIVAVAAPGDA